MSLPQEAAQIGPRSIRDRIVEWREQAARDHAEYEASPTSPGALYLQGRATIFERCADEAELALRLAPVAEPAARFPCGCERHYCPTHVPKYLGGT